MNLLSIFIGLHDTSFSFFKDNILKYYYMEERFSRIKKDHKINYLTEILEKYFLNKEKIDIIILSVLNHYDNILHKNNIFNFKEIIEKKFNVILHEDNHHLFHAYSGFYSSPFDKSLCIISDGAGTINDNNCKNYLKNIKIEDKTKSYFEQESVFLLEKNKLPKILYKKYIINNHTSRLKNKKEKYDFLFDNNHFEFTNDLKKLSSAAKYAVFCEYICNMSHDDSGKIMGLAQYKGYENKLPKSTHEIVQVKYVTMADILQKNTQQRIIDLILKYKNEVDTKNVIISGGYAMNCVANYEYLKYVNAENLWIDPIGFDGGQSIGAAYYYQNINK